MIRKLYLLNEKGVSFMFDYTTQVLISELDGLGFSHDISYLKYGNFYFSVDKEHPLTKVTARLTFLNGYKGYTDLLDFLKGSQTLELHYSANGTKYCYIEIESIDKKELIAGTLQCLVTFDKLSPWLRKSTLLIDLEENMQGKIYPHTYPHNYSVTFEGKTTLNNSGNYKAFIRVEISGAVTNPEINIYQNNQVVTSMKLNVESEFCEITVDPNPMQQVIEMTENGQTRNIYHEQDFTRDNFLKVDPGLFEIEFKPGVSESILCRVILTEVFTGH